MNEERMISFFTTNLIWTEGSAVLVVLIAVALAGFQWFRPFAYVAFGAILFSFFFFRNPERKCVAALNNPRIIVCPADGTVVDIKYDPDRGLEGYAYRVSIFLSLFDVHVNWIPLSGIITDVTYSPGQFVGAFLAKSSLLNEHNDVTLRTPDGDQIMVRQIAGTIARRICCWVHPEHHARAGEKFGMIRFGSRVDLFLPDTVRLNVDIGQRVYGGYTAIGEIFK